MLAWIKKQFVKNEDPVPDFPFNPGEIEFYLLSIYSELITKNNLSIEYHYKIAAYLEKAVYEGFGLNISNVPFTSPQYDILQKLRRHIYVFSAAKQYSQVREMSEFINVGGVKSTFKEFRDHADKVFEAYNKNYLRTEYTTAVGQSEMAKQWTQFEEQKETLPVLRYHTQKDARVRDEHAALEGITRPIGDPFWNTYMPKNGWRCRCFVTQHSDQVKKTDMTKRVIPEFGDKGFPKVFRMNPGKDGLIFNPKFHPYFHVAKGDAEFRNQNFGLPIL